MSVVLIHRRPVVEVRVDGSVVPDVTGVEWSYGFGQVPCQASFTVVRIPSWVQARSRVEIDAGATAATTATRFAGQVYDFPSYKGSPREVTVDCRGDLIAAATTLVGEDTADTDVPGLDLSDRTQAQQICAVLDALGLAARYTPALIGGPPTVLGILSADLAGNKNPNVWKRNTTGLSFIQARDAIGLGYRLVEGPLPLAYGGGFGIYRPQISPRPAPTSPVSLIEGMDIGGDSTASHNDALDVYNRIVVEGGDYGEGPIKAVAVGPHPRPDPLVPYQTAPPLKSPLIETVALAQQLADWQLLERDQIVLSAEVSTPRADLFRLEQSIAVSLFDRYEIQQTLWLRQVSGSVRAGQPFRQKLSLRAPAAPGVGGVLLPQESWPASGWGALGYGLNWWSAVTW